MAGENALDSEADTMAPNESAIDEAVDDLRGVLMKDAGEEPDLTDESVDGMGGVAAFGSDFGIDGDDAADENDPFNIGDAPEAVAPDLGATDFGGDFGGAADLEEPGLGGMGGGFGDVSGLGQDFSAAPEAPASENLGASGSSNRMDLVLGIPIDVQIVLGTSRMAVSSLMNLTEGATIALDRKIGEPVEIMVNGKLIGRGEITVLESDETRFAVRIIEVIGADKKKSS